MHRCEPEDVRGSRVQLGFDMGKPRHTSPEGTLMPNPGIGCEEATGHRRRRPVLTGWLQHADERFSASHSDVGEQEMGLLLWKSLIRCRIS